VKPNKQTCSTVEPMELTPKLVASWQPPPFQRPFVLNGKCQEVIEQIKREGVLPGVITLGVLRAAQAIKYTVDGQHRLGCYMNTDLPVAYADVRTIYCDSMAEMAEEFVRLNQSLRKMTPDDVLRGLEASYAPLRTIREKCRFVGYDKVRRSDKSPILSMSMVLRTWRGSAAEVPVSATPSAATLAATLSSEDAEQLIGFLTLCFDAWGRDREYAKLWSGLNLNLCAWMYRRMVLTQYSSRTPRITRDVFRKCLMSVSANRHYVDWLVGRNVGERDRSPGYSRLRTIFAERLAVEMGKRPNMPAPAWATSK
jgi:hypothetical protein